LPDIKATIGSYRADLLKIGSILGIFTESPKAYFDKKKSAAVDKKSIDTAMIDQMIKEREQARKTKDFSKADEIRKELENMNVLLEDRPDGTVWKIKD